MLFLASELNRYLKILQVGTSKCLDESRHLLIHSHNWRSTTETQRRSSNITPADIAFYVEKYQTMVSPFSVAASGTSLGGSLILFGHRAVQRLPGERSEHFVHNENAVK